MLSAKAVASVFLPLKRPSAQYCAKVSFSLTMPAHTTRSGSGEIGRPAKAMIRSPGLAPLRILGLQMASVVSGRPRLGGGAAVVGHDVAPQRRHWCLPIT